jgi:1-piperideine-2-carboxylate/1-pyrroline-2-carboxylate reductase [NAD(P)H]
MNIPPATAAPEKSTGIIVCDQARTAELLDYSKLVEAIAQAAAELETGTILSPERLVVPLGDGGVLLSMPATAADIGIHKLVNVQPGNAARRLPTIHGTVTVCNAVTGQIMCVLDGPEVTGRRTAAVTLLAIHTLLSHEPMEFLLFGTGVQARYHLQAIHSRYPQSRVWVRGRNAKASADFCISYGGLHDRVQPCEANIPDVDVVITLTTSTRPIYNELARPERLVIGVGAFKPEMAELGEVTLNSSDLYADDPVGARHEAGDLLRANIDWARVSSLSAALRGPADASRPAVFKSVGTAAWDLAAARVALQAMK